jgi:metallophosphoesterase (TIGR00282 family)
LTDGQLSRQLKQQAFGVSYKISGAIGQRPQRQLFMRILFLGDLVGKPGYAGVVKHAQSVREEHQIDALVVNAENASDGSGLMPRQHKRLIESGVDLITLGDHIYRCKEIIPTLKKSDRIVKPANYPGDAPGRTWAIAKTPRGPLGVISLLGRVYMRPVDCPFDAVDRALAEIGDQARHVIVDVHAEATSDKQVLARYLDGKVTAVVGTHTHVPTADAAVLPGGTAFQCDVGMCGPYDSIIGRDIKRVTQTTRSFEPCHFHVATGDVRLCGAIIEAKENGKAKSIERFEMKIKSNS